MKQTKLLVTALSEEEAEKKVKAQKDIKYVLSVVEISKNYEVIVLK